MKLKLEELCERFRPKEYIVAEQAVWINSHLITPEGKIEDMR